LNVQDQQKNVWVPSFALARAYLDQLARSNGLASETIAAARTTLASAERSGSQSKAALTQLASQLNVAAASARDQAKVRLLSSAVTDLANAQR
jgi:hypothetical protein